MLLDMPWGALSQTGWPLVALLAQINQRKAQLGVGRPESYIIQLLSYTELNSYAYIWHSPGQPQPPPPGNGHGSLPRPLWEWVGWLWMGGNAG